jgi:hypothetical protein
VFDSELLNGFSSLTFGVALGTVPDTFEPATRCTIPGDPPEECGNGVDEDFDGLTDEEPDTDGDGLSNCTDLDDDGDGFLDELEGYLGTDPLNGCPAHVSDSAWPPDIDNDQNVSVMDVLEFKDYILTTVPPSLARFDLVHDGEITIQDVLAIKPYIFGTCS